MEAREQRGLGQKVDHTMAEGEEEKARGKHGVKRGQEGQAK